jgi:hypothetical protein
VPPAHATASVTNQRAIWSFVLGLIAVTGCGVTGIPALVLGYKARREIRESSGAQNGDGLAMAGVVLGWIGSVLTLVALVFVGAMLALVIAVGDDLPDDDPYECTPYDEYGNYDEFNTC